MSEGPQEDSPRRRELLEAAYAHIAGRGTVEVALRPLAAAIGSSPRVLLYLFGSKDGLIRALLERARRDELLLLDAAATGAADLPTVVEHLWEWHTDPAHRAVLVLWVEAYARSLGGADGPWSGFAARTVDDWLRLLRDVQPADVADTPEGAAERTLALAVLRGAMLDLVATGDVARTTAAVRRHASSRSAAGATGP